MTEIKNSFLLGLVLVISCGFIGGKVAKKLGAPPLLGMIIVGILLGAEIGNLLPVKLIELADQLRTFAVMVILLRAGLGLDREKLRQQSSVALKLGFLPAIAEMIVVAFVSRWLFDFDLLTGLLLGSVVAAESPAVIVPGMLKLKNLGYGVAKGIPDAILTGSALSDVVIFLVFSLLVNFFTRSSTGTSTIAFLPVQVLVQIIFGLILGYLAARLFVWLAKRRVTQNVTQETLLVACIALLLIISSQNYPYFSGYLAAMTMGFYLSELSPPIARTLRAEFQNLWEVAEIILFVLLGAVVQLSVLEDLFFPGLLLLAIGLLCGRSWGWYLSTMGSNWQPRERLFLLPGNSAKATVQAAIGSIPFSLGIPGGEIILAIAALAILVTAPLGAWAIPTFAPRLLSKDPTDPTKITVNTQTRIVVLIQDLVTGVELLSVAGDRARRSNSRIVVIAVKSLLEEQTQLEKLINRLLLDLEREIVTNCFVDHRDLDLFLDYLQANQISDLIVAKASSHIFLKSSQFCELEIPLTVI